MTLNDDKPLVSIVTPTYNRMFCIEDAIESVLGQTYENVEYIVVDDASTDDTYTRLIEKYGDRIKVFKNETNLGQSASLNNAWSLCKGKYIGYLSSDDVLYPDAISSLVRVLEYDEEIVCIYPDSNLIDINSNVLKKNVCKLFDLRETVVSQECYVGPGVLFRKSIFRAIGGWNSELILGPDRDYWIRVSSLGKVIFLPRILAAYRYHEGSMALKGCSEAVAAEFVSVLDSYYAKGDIPESLAASKQEAYASAYFLIARYCMRGGHFCSGMLNYNKARKLHYRFRGSLVFLRLILSAWAPLIRCKYHKIKAYLK